MRENHYKWVEDCLGSLRPEKPRFHCLLYINVPRLDMYAVASSIPIPNLEIGSARCFSDLGFEAGRVMAKYAQILNAEDLYAHHVGERDVISSLEIGQYVFIGVANFRTVAIGMQSNLETAWASEKSVIYKVFDSWKLICKIDPMWITTSTAGSTLKSGQARLCGVVRISQIDIEACKVYASPLFLAQPGGTLDAH